MPKFIEKFMLVGPAVILLLALFPGSGRTVTTDEILAGIQERYSAAGGIKAEYTRVTTTPAMDGVFQSTSTHTASGVLYFRKPAQLILDQDSPRPEKMITDGRTVWWYIPEEKQVHRYTNVNVYGELGPLLDFLNGLGKLEGEYAVKVTPAGTTAVHDHRLELTRLKKGGGPNAITVWVSPQDYTLKGFRLNALTGEETVFKLNRMELNPDVGDAAFTFKIPEGTTVIDEEGGRL